MLIEPPLIWHSRRGCIALGFLARCGYARRMLIEAVRDDRMFWTRAER